MRVFVESLLPCGAEAAWGEVQTSALLAEVATPMVTFHPLPGEQLPARWEAQRTARCRFSLFGLIPLGTHTLFIERIDPVTHEIQSREHDSLVRRWDHRVRVEAAGEGECRYSDEIEIEAGWLMPVVWLFAVVFYHHRQRRWRRVALRVAERQP